MWFVLKNRESFRGLLCRSESGPSRVCPTSQETTNLHPEGGRRTLTDRNRLLRLGTDGPGMTERRLEDSRDSPPSPAITNSSCQGQVETGGPLRCDLDVLRTQGVLERPLRVTNSNPLSDSPDPLPPDPLPRPICP